MDEQKQAHTQKKGILWPLSLSLSSTKEKEWNGMEWEWLPFSHRILFPLPFANIAVGKWKGGAGDWFLASMAHNICHFVHDSVQEARSNVGLMQIHAPRKTKKDKEESKEKERKKERKKERVSWLHTSPDNQDVCSHEVTEWEADQSRRWGNVSRRGGGLWSSFDVCDCAKP
jgi:hypothetical protein